MKKNFSPPGGLEPPTFRLTAERASRLRHGGMCWDNDIVYKLIFRFYVNAIFIAIEKWLNRFHPNASQIKANSMQFPKKFQFLG